MIDKLLKSQNKPQALLVIEAYLSNFDDFLKKYMKSIVCVEHGCNKCKWCEKIDKNKYFDLYVFDAKINFLKKNEILELIQKFSFNGTESINRKFYVIKNIEAASKQALNSLLKFVEEPPENTYSIFTTRKLNSILPTISSRCSNFILMQDSKKIDDFLATTQLTNIQKAIIKKSYDSYENIKNNINDYVELFNFCLELNNKNYILTLKNKLDLFKNYDFIKINVILNILKELLSNKADYFVSLQDTLYLNPNKTLLFNMILNGIKQNEKSNI